MQIKCFQIPVPMHIPGNRILITLDNLDYSIILPSKIQLISENCG